MPDVLDQIGGDILAAPVATPDVPLEHELEHAAESVEHTEEHESHDAEHAAQQETLNHIAEQVTETHALEEAEWRQQILSNLQANQSALENLTSRLDSLTTLTHSSPESSSPNVEDGPKEVEIAVEPLETEPQRKSRRLPYRSRKR